MSHPKQGRKKTEHVCCEACNGQGWIRPENESTQKCETCDGRGYVEVER